MSKHSRPRSNSPSPSTSYPWRSREISNLFGPPSSTDPYPSLTSDLLKFSMWVAPTSTEVGLRKMLKGKFVEVIERQIKGSSVTEFGSRGKPVEIWASDLDLIVTPSSSSASPTNPSSRSNSPVPPSTEFIASYNLDDDSDLDVNSLIDNDSNHDSNNDSDGLGFIDSDSDGDSDCDFKNTHSAFVIDRNPSPVPQPSSSSSQKDQKENHSASATTTATANQPSNSTSSSTTHTHTLTTDISLNLTTSPHTPLPPHPPHDRKKTVKYLKKIAKPLYSSPYCKKTLLLSKAKVPIITLTTPWNVSLDIAIEGLGEDTSSYSGQFTHRSNYANLVRFVKTLLKCYNYDRVYTGGVGSYKVYVMAGYISEAGGSLAEMVLRFLRFDWSKVKDRFTYKNGQIDFLSTHKLPSILSFFSWAARTMLDNGLEGVFNERKTGVVKMRGESERRAKVGVSSNLLNKAEDVQGFGKGEVSLKKRIVIDISNNRFEGALV
ncbi:hypothetical protein TrLO_g1672 [Triparma laevis f. longispina]|uniref:Uncharacterized protein n=1 Tax=Triparma laevis f. longispina TaxID=1714387 RepID=A0A9W7EDI0_9STRA|nr:hypothetical protein TrLO_g1672 [Triparma laevis f. longispina]